MPSIRVGFGSDYTLKNQRVGIGTDNPRAELDVRGTLKGDFNITGVSTLSVYSGFAAQKQNITKDSSIGFSTTGIGTVGVTSFISVNERETGFLSLVGEYNTLSEDLIVDEGRIFEVSTTQNIGITTIGTQSVYVPSDSVVSAGTLESISVQSHFSVPNGGTSTRTADPVEGMVRFNDDLNTLEFWNGFEWRQFTVTGASGRGVFAGGNTPTVVSTIQYVNISSLGNSQDFGSLTASRVFTSGCSSSTRGLYGGGLNPALVNIIEYITIASNSNSIDFGDLFSPASGRYISASCSSSTRGIWAGGYVPAAPAGYSNVIDYVTISTIGNALDFGDLIIPKMTSGFSSPTRGIFSGGYVPGSTITQNMDFITISSTGNAVLFGEMNVRRSYSASLSNSVRGIFGGGVIVTPSSVIVNTIDYVTIASTGNAISFGDMSQARRLVAGSSTQIRGVFAGGGTSVPASQVNTIDYVTIASTGNAQDFGDLTSVIQGMGSCSDSHGGLGGF